MLIRIRLFGWIGMVSKLFRDMAIHNSTENKQEAFDRIDKFDKFDRGIAIGVLVDLPVDTAKTVGQALVHPIDTTKAMVGGVVEGVSNTYKTKGQNIADAAEKFNSDLEKQYETDPVGAGRKAAPVVAGFSSVVVGGTTGLVRFGLRKGGGGKVDIVDESPNSVTPDLGGKPKLEIGKVEDYGTSKKTTGDGTVQRDHQPSTAALILRAEEIKGGPLSPAEIRRIENDALTVTVPADVHRAGPTYGGKNTKAQQLADAQDLQAAAKRDSNAMVENGQTMAPENVPELESACGKITCRTNEDYDDFLNDRIDE